MSQVIRKFITNDAVDGTKIHLDNNQAIRARNAANSADVNLLLLDASNIAQVNAALNASGTVTGSNLSGTNTGNVTLAAVGAVANANGASLSGQVLNLQPFSSAFPGVVTASGGGTTNFLRADGTWAAPSGGSGANTALSNLIATAINQDLVFDKGSAAFVRTKDDATADTQDITFKSGVATGFNSGGVQVASGDGENSGQVSLASGNAANATGVSGSIIAQSGASIDGASGGISLSSGAPTGAGISGAIAIQSGDNSGTGNTGAASLKTGNSPSGASGALTLLSGTTVSSNSGSVSIFSGAASGAANSGDLLAGSGINSGSGDSGIVSISTGSSTANSGGLFLNSGNSSTAGNTGAVSLVSGNNAGSGNTGDLTLSTGNATAGGSGTITLNSGAADGNTGGVSIQSGSPSSANNSSGNISIQTGAVTGSGNSPGSITIQVGSPDNDPGADLSLVQSTPTGTGSRGKIKFINGSEGTAGYVWTSTDTLGSGEWMPGGGSSATNLKQLTVLSGTDITNQYVDLAHVARTDSIDFVVKGGGIQIQGASYDYSVSYTGGAGGNTRITFLNDLATGGPAALVAGDVVVIKYEY